MHVPEAVSVNVLKTELFQGAPFRSEAQGLPTQESCRHVAWPSGTACHQQPPCGNHLCSRGHRGRGGSGPSRTGTCQQHRPPSRGLFSSSPVTSLRQPKLRTSSLSKHPSQRRPLGYPRSLNRKCALLQAHGRTRTPQAAWRLQHAEAEGAAERAGNCIPTQQPRDGTGAPAASPPQQHPQPTWIPSPCGAAPGASGSERGPV